MIGGIPFDFGQNYKLGNGPWFVIEGDEYDTAFFDKGPKFLHYAPRMVILTSIEFDHADIYRDLEHVVESFRRLIALVPDDGLIIANGDDSIIWEEVKQAGCPVELYGFGNGNRWRVAQEAIQDGWTHVDILREGEPYAEVVTPLYGRHNISNLLSTVVLANALEIPLPQLKKALRSFQGVKRRQEVIGKQNGVLILDDFAHHPTAVRETVKAVKKHYSGRLIAVFEPRSNSSRRNIFQAQYAGAFEGADQVMIPEPPLMAMIPPEDRFSSEGLVNDLKHRGTAATYFEHTELLLEHLIETVQPGDVVLFMSNGGFDNLPRRLFAGRGDDYRLLRTDNSTKIFFAQRRPSETKNKGFTG
ncbi:MAG: Mur ligase family protein [Deltaproteobacteria bacterium]|nr:Mur ligase family protein [Deltaproteobacteria bacterium]